MNVRSSWRHGLAAAALAVLVSPLFVRADDGGVSQASSAPPLKTTCPGLALSDNWEGSCTREGDTLTLTLHVEGIKSVVVRKTGPLPKYVAFSFVSWRFEHFSVRAEGPRGAGPARCGEALHAQCEDPRFRATVERKELNEADGGVTPTPNTEMVVNVVAPSSVFERTHGLRFGWIDAYRH